MRPTEYEEGLSILAVNAGGQSVTVVDIGMEVYVPWRRKQGYVLPCNRNSGVGLPSRVEPGHAETWFLPWTEVAYGELWLADQQLKHVGPFRPRTVVYVQTGEQWLRQPLEFHYWTHRRAEFRDVAAQRYSGA